jgi:hypothetical protein
MTGYPAAGTVLAAALVVTGGLCFAAQRRTAPPASGAAERHRPGRWLLRPGFMVLVGVNLAIGGFFGAMPISVTAFAIEHGAAGTAAALFTVSSCASLLAGLAVPPILVLCLVLAEAAVHRAVLT